MKKLVFNTIIISVLLLGSCGGNSPEDQFVNAAGEGDLATVESLLSQGVDINCQNTGLFSSEETACMKAAENGELKILKFLIEKGADIHKANSGGENPISYAAKNNHSEIVLYLIKQGADVNYQESNYGMTAILQASHYGDIDYMKQLLDLGADISIRGKDGQTPLTMACSSQNADAAKLLIKHGADPDLPGLYGWTPLMVSVQTIENNTYELPEDIKKTIDVLLASGADINKQDADGNTVLIHAGMEKSHGVSDYLVLKGADVTIRNNAGGDYIDAFNSDSY